MRFSYCAMLPFLVALPLLVAPLRAEEASADDKDKKEKITYDQHVRAVFRQNCFACHNSNDAKGGLSLDSYGKTMEGGSSGEVVFAGDLESSRLWHLVDHQDTPKMPPMSDKLAANDLGIIRRWIEGGALENSGSKAQVKDKPSYDLAQPAGGKPEGEPAMPEGLWRQPVVHTPRPGQVTAIATSPWAPLAAVSGQRQVLLYHTGSGELLGVLPYPEGIPHVLRFSRNGALLLAGGGQGSYSGSVVAYDVKTGRRVMKVGDELDVVLAADINDTQTMIALGGPGRMIRIYSTRDGSLLHEIKKHTEWVTGLEFSPDGVLLASADRNGGLVVWEAQTAREYMSLEGHKEGITDISWRSDSNVLASASEDGTVKLWEMIDGKNIKTVRAGAGVQSVDYSRDGRLLTVGRDKQPRVFDGEGKELAKFDALPDIGLECAFGFEGKRVLAGDWSGKVALWQIEDKQQLAELSPNPPTLQMRLAAAEQQELSAAAAVKPVEAAAAQAVSEREVARKALADLVAKFKSNEAQLAAAQQALAKQDAAWKAASAKSVELEAQRKAAAEGLAQAKSELETAQSAQTKASASLQSVENEHSAKVKAQEDLVAQIEAGQESAEKQGIAVQAARETLTQKEAALTAAESALAKAREELESAADDAKKAAQQKVDALTAGVEQARKEVAAASQAYKEVEQAMTMLLEAQAARKESLQALEREILALSTRVKQEREIVKQAREDVGSRSRKVDELAAAEKSVQMDLTQQEHLKAATMKALAATREQIATTTAAVNAMKPQIAAQESRVKTLAAAAAKEEARLAAVRQTYQDSVAATQRIRNELGDFLQVNQRLQQQIEQAQQQAAKVRQQVVAMEERWQVAQSQAKSARDQFAVLEKQMAELKARFEAAKTEQAAAAQVAREAAEEVASNKAKAAEVEAQAEQLLEQQKLFQEAYGPK